jgi:copper chaperone CopZ
LKNCKKKYEEVLPKVDPKLISDLLLRQMENPRSAPPIYMVETFLEPGTDTQKVRDTIVQETGMAPAIYDNGTHVAVRHPLTLDMLERISNKEGVIEVTGEYDTGTWAASHEHSRRREMAARSRKPPASIVSNSSSQTAQATEIRELEKTKSAQQRQSRKETRKSKYMIAVYTTAGIIGAIALAGFIISGGMLPNSNSGIQSSSSSSATTADSGFGNEPGAIYGYVEGLRGLPAIGASVIAENLQTGQSTSAFVSLTGQYSINLTPGTYEITVSFPNGATQVVDSFELTRGTANEINFNYNE